MEEQWMNENDYKRLSEEFGVVGMTLKKAKAKIAEFCNKDSSYKKLGAELVVELTRRAGSGLKGKSSDEIDFDEASRRVFFAL